MSGGYVEDFGKVYGCFNCGEIMGEYTLSLEGYCMCSTCKEPTVISFETALDVMIDLQNQGHTFTPTYYDDDLEFAVVEEDS